MASQDAQKLGKNCDFEKLLQQRFSLPPSIIYNMAKNPISPSGYQKLTQTCKYFYARNPIIVVDFIWLFDDSFHVYLNKDKHPYRIRNARQILCKFWYNDINISSKLTVATEILRDKTFRVNKICLCNNVVLDEVLPSESVQSINEVYLQGTPPENANGSPMTIEQILEFFPNLEVFDL